MPLSTDQQAEIEAQRAQSHQTRRVVAAGMEDHLYTAHQVLDHGFVRVIDYNGGRCRDLSGCARVLRKGHQIGAK